jgi:DNA-binding transcriptional LysR family regulator
VDLPRTHELQYFVTVAQELHFGRSAARLGIAQPQLSRSIKALEDRLGVRLLDRSSRSVRLTAAGRVLLDEGQRALAAVTAATQRTQRAGRSGSRLALTFKPGGDGGLLREILDAYATHPAAEPVELIPRRSHERVTALRTGAADIGLLHRTDTDIPGLDVVDLLSERQVAVLSRDHRLAGHVSIALADLDGAPITRMDDPAAPPDGDPIRDAGHLAQMIALGRAIAIVPESVRAYLRPDLTTVPVRDAPAATLVLAWPEQRRDPELAAFVRTAVEVAQRRRRAGRLRSLG